MNLETIKEQALKNGITPGKCPVCGAELVITNRVDIAWCPEMSSNAIEFVCPNDRDHIPIEDRRVYRISRKYDV